MVRWLIVISNAMKWTWPRFVTTPTPHQLFSLSFIVGELCFIYSGGIEFLSFVKVSSRFCLEKQNGSHLVLVYDHLLYKLKHLYIRSSIGTLTSDIGTLTSSIGTLTSSIGILTAYIGILTSSIGILTSSTGTLASSLWI